jgi:uncharacterized repeat protein (TIGR02543 family)
LLVVLSFLLCLASSASAHSLHYVLFVTRQGDGSFSVSGPGTQPDDVSVSCPDACTGSFSTGEHVTLTITIGSDTVFDGWGGDCSGTQPTCVVTMDGPHSVYAYARHPDEPPLIQQPGPPPPPPTVKLTVLKAGRGTGYVGGGGGVDCGPTCSVTPTLGQDLQLVALPDKNSTFSGWLGACAGQKSPCNLTMSTDRQTTAVFLRVDKQPPTATALSATVQRGKTELLRYRVSDDSGQARVAGTVARGRDVIATLNAPRARVTAGKVYSLTWKVPTSTALGSWRFCLVAVDPAHNRSRRSCTTVTVI